MNQTEARPPEVLVVGSANLDLVLRPAALPGPGETVLARSLQTFVGGKGLNQAVAAARAGARTAFLGAVGDDDAGTALTAALRRDGVDVSGIRRVQGPSGTAIVLVDDGGENAIVVAPGASSALDPLSPAELDSVAAADVVVMQLEIPAAAVASAAAVAHEAGRHVILNAAPAIAHLPREVSDAVDTLVVNRGEAAALGGGGAADDPTLLAERLVERYRSVVVSLGADGVVWAERGGSPTAVPAWSVEAIDTTGAGDTFTGSLAAGIASGLHLGEAVRYAIVAAALTVTKAGASDAIPYRSEVVAAMESHQTPRTAAR